MSEPRKWFEIVADKLKRCNTTYDAFADDCGISRGRFAALLIGTARPVLHELDAMAEALKCQVFELFLDLDNGWHRGRLVQLRETFSGGGLVVMNPSVEKVIQIPPPTSADDLAQLLLARIAQDNGPRTVLGWLLDSYGYRDHHRPCSQASSSASAPPPSPSASSCSGSPGGPGTGSTATATP